jgi:hypothetical protein
VTNVLSQVAKLKLFANSGVPAAGYKLFTYEAGTNTKLATYQGPGTGSPNANPTVLDFRGEANVWVPPNVAYKYIFSPPNDTDPPTSPIWTVDNIVDSQLVTLYGGVDTGIANAYVLNFVANFTAYADGIAIFWIPANTNTGASTINVNGLGPVNIINQDGSALYLGQLQANQFALIIYKGTGFVLIDFGLLPTINTQNTNYTLAIGDANNIVLHNDANPYTWTIPANATVAFPVGTSIDLIQSGITGLISIAAAGGVTLNSFGGFETPPITLASGCSTRIVKTGINTWQQVTLSNLGVSGSFTGTLTGMTGSVTGQIDYFLENHQVTLYRSGGSSAVTGTSNTTAMTMTGLPAAIRPKFDTRGICSGVVDNGNGVACAATVSSAGVVSFGIVANPIALFTNSGTKGISAGWSLIYPLF